jgi:hypothetical protein
VSDEAAVGDAAGVLVEKGNARLCGAKNTPEVSRRSEGALGRAGSTREIDADGASSGGRTLELPRSNGSAGREGMPTERLVPRRSATFAGAGT